ncbi:tannase/feruloyl esterase family alpha/beta hydrolase [Paracoccus sp. (in: a-proteobacteria)]|uniref:tannase/feruloyl esterase family alpha/beta hydrolase n=1 Tax=Paracoccus sp. TaxID=267 RepID=UPI003A8937A6
MIMTRACTLAAILPMLAGTPAMAQDSKACAALAGVAAFDTIVSRAEPVPAANGQPAHCLVQGVIEPRIGAQGRAFGTGFELRMPMDWTGRFLMQGGGGNDGLVRPAVGVIDRSRPADTALGRGFAVASTDSGHTADSPTDAWYRIDAKANEDHAYNSVRLVTERSRDLMQRFYGKPPDHSYFMGCSNGGRQAMMAAHVMPDAFDGIVSVAPAFTVTPRILGWHWAVTSLAAAAPDGIAAHAFSDDELQMISDAAVAACDAGDGAEDGLVFRPVECRFDPVALQCADGESGQCLSGAQVTALKNLQSGPLDDNGTAIYEGWPLFNIDGKTGIRAWLIGDSEGPKPNSRAYQFVSNWLQTIPDKPRKDMTVENFTHADRGWLLALKPQADASGTDYQPFANAGGKIVWVHGNADPAFSVRDFVRWLQSFRADNPDYHDFSRAYLVPGLHHCAGGAGLISFDVLKPMVDWVESGIAPAEIMASTGDGTQRPLCDFPAYARPGPDGAGFVCGN